MGRWSLQSLEVLGSMFGFPVSSEAKQGSAELVDYLKGLLDSYRHRPADNIGAHLVTLSMQGEISEKDLLAFAQFLFVAGHETNDALSARPIWNPRSRPNFVFSHKGAARAY